MTHENKIQKCMSELNQTKEEAQESVAFLNWVEKEHEFLTSIHRAFKRDIKPNASFIEMCRALWNDETTGIKQSNYFIN